LNYTRRLKIGAFVGLVAAALLGSAITHDDITGIALLLYPAGLALGLVIAHLGAARKIGRGVGASSTPSDYYKARRQ
jgi:hypothetical protein